MELIKRGKIWHYDHKWGSQRLRGSTGCSDKYKARMFAEKKIRDITTKGVDVKDNDFGKFIEKYWELFPNNRKKTVSSKKIALNHFIAFAHPSSVAEISTEQCQKFYANYLLGTKKMKIISANTNIRMLRQVFEPAEDWGYTPRNPFRKVRLERDQENDTRVMTKAEIDKFLQYVRTRCPRYYDLFYFYFLTGMRMMEPFQLKWIDIDFDGGRIHLTWTKTKYNRTVIMLPDVLQMLQTRQLRGEKKPFDMYYKNATNMIETIRLEAGLDMPWISIKVFRRCTSSYLKAIGVSDTIVNKILGHTKDVALGEYFGLPNAELAKAVAPLQDLLPKYDPPMSQSRHKDEHGRFSKPI